MKIIGENGKIYQWFKPTNVIFRKTQNWKVVKNNYTDTQFTRRFDSVAFSYLVGMFPGHIYTQAIKCDVH